MVKNHDRVGVGTNNNNIEKVVCDWCKRGYSGRQGFLVCVDIYGDRLEMRIWVL